LYDLGTPLFIIIMLAFEVGKLRLLSTFVNDGTCCCVEEVFGTVQDVSVAILI
jgi:hypothetical protein